MFRVKSPWRIKSEWKFKSIYKLFLILTMLLLMCACGKVEEQVTDSAEHKDMFSKPGGIMSEVGIDTSIADGVEEKTVFDNMTENSEYSSTDDETIEVVLDTSSISEKAVSNIINKTAKDNGIDGFEVVDRYEDKMTSTISYTIHYSDNSYWVIMYNTNTGQAYAVKDEFGEFDETDETDETDEAGETIESGEVNEAGETIESGEVSDENLSESDLTETISDENLIDESDIEEN